MLHAYNFKRVAITNPVAIVDNASWTTNEVDTAGYAHVVINVMLGANDIAIAAFKLQESDTSGSGFADITGAIFGTSNNDTGSASTLPSATDDDKLFSIFVDLKGRKRYLDLVLTNGDGTVGGFAVAWAELHRAQDAPRTAVETGYSQRLVV